MTESTFPLDTSIDEVEQLVHDHAKWILANDDNVYTYREAYQAAYKIEFESLNNY